MFPPKNPFLKPFPYGHTNFLIKNSDSTAKNSPIYLYRKSKIDQKKWFKKSKTRKIKFWPYMTPYQKMFFSYFLMLQSLF